MTLEDTINKIVVSTKLGLFDNLLVVAPNKKSFATQFRDLSKGWVWDGDSLKNGEANIKVVSTAKPYWQEDMRGFSFNFAFCTQTLTESDIGYVNSRIRALS